jgi:hypothetical protein
MFTLPVGYISFFSSVNVVAFSVSTRLSWKRGKHVSNVNFLTLDQRYPTIIPDVLGSIIQYDHQPIVFARWQKKQRSTLHTAPQQQRVCTFRAVRDQLISCHQFRPFTDLYKP